MWRGGRRHGQPEEDGFPVGQRWNGSSSFGDQTLLDAPLVLGSSWPTLSPAHGHVRTPTAVGGLLMEGAQCSQAPEPSLPSPLLPVLGPPSEPSPLPSWVSCQSEASPACKRSHLPKPRGLCLSTAPSHGQWEQAQLLQASPPLPPYPIFCLAAQRVVGGQGP